MRGMPLANRRPQGNCKKVFSRRSAVAISVSAARAIYRDGEDEIGREIRREATAYRRIRPGDDRSVGLASFLASQRCPIYGSRSTGAPPRTAEQVYRRRYAQHVCLSGDLEVKLAGAISAVLFGALAGFSQGLDPAMLVNPSSSIWPTYNGDYSGRRYSSLNQINESNISSLTVAWAFRADTVPVKSTPLMVNGALYFTVPDHAWAIDARTGRSIWHYHYNCNGGAHIGNRGVGMYKDWLYFETPDCHLVCLNAKDGKQRWKVELGDVKLGYFATMAP